MNNFEQMEKEYPILRTKPAYQFGKSLTQLVEKIKKATKNGKRKMC